jgi:hypothetical protein
VRKNIMVMGGVAKEAPYFMVARSRKCAKGRGGGQIYTLQMDAPSDPLPPTRFHLRIAHLAMNSSMY